MNMRLMFSEASGVSEGVQKTSQADLVKRTCPPYNPFSVRRKDAVAVCFLCSSAACTWRSWVMLLADELERVGLNLHVGKHRRISSSAPDLLSLANFLTSSSTQFHRLFHITLFFCAQPMVTTSDVSLFECLASYSVVSFFVSSLALNLTAGEGRTDETLTEG